MCWRRGRPSVGEGDAQRSIQAAFGRGDGRLWRNNVGQAWLGPWYRTEAGHVIVTKPMRVRYGLCEGSSDLIGFKSMTVTADMVGKRVAVFTAVEVKSLKGRTSEIQQNFIALVQAKGGLAGVARDTEQAARILAAFDEGASPHRLWCG